MNNIFKLNNKSNYATILYVLISTLVGFSVAYFFNYKPERSGHELQELILLIKVIVIIYIII